MAQLRQQHPLFQFTPLREGRHCLPRDEGGVPYFNSRPSARGDITGGFITDDDGTFQFTPLREGRPYIRRRSGSLSDTFQFTPLREGRRWKAHSLKEGDLFQFTPLREGRPQQHHGVSGLCNFNSRPSARGDAQPRNRQARCSAHFNSRPSARGDKILQPDAVEKLIFQFTPLREGRPPDRLRISRRSHFNSRPSARGDVGVSSPPAQPHISIHAPPRGATSLRAVWEAA